MPPVNQPSNPNAVPISEQPIDSTQAKPNQQPETAPMPAAAPELPSQPSSAPSSQPAPIQQPIQQPQVPVTTATAPTAPTSPNPVPGSNPVVADDVDVIEKEWVDQADKIVEQTKNDPYLEEEAIEALQIDYLKKRYGHDVKKPNSSS